MIEFIKEMIEVANPLKVKEFTEVNGSMRDISGSFSEGLKEWQSTEGIDEIRGNYSNVDAVLADVGEKLNQAETEIELDMQMKRIEKYKGTVFEDMIKEEVKPLFEGIEEKQRIVETVEGDTKPDIIFKEAKEDFTIGNTEVKKGEDLFCEVKCGKKEYIESEMAHIEKQVLGHQEGKSVVIVTKDYLEISPDKRATFEARLEQYGSSVCVVDVAAEEVEEALINQILSKVRV